MTGIEKIGVHIPRYRLARADIAAIWSGQGKHGSRAVANYDEDALTMAVEAGDRCLDGVDPDTIDLVILASSTLPYAEKQSAAIVAEALDLRSDIDTLDVASSLRGGTQALKAGLNAIAGGGARRVLVVASDMRKAQTGSRSEPEFGDGAVAFLLGPDAIATLRCLRSEYSTAMDRWRLADDAFIRTGDERFTSKVVHQDSLVAAIDQALAAINMTPAQVEKIAVAASSHGAAIAVAAAAGFPAETVTGESIYAKAGYCGVAAGLLNLVAGLERVAPGGHVLLANYGDGTDILLATVLDPVRTSLDQLLDDGVRLPYGQYLRFKELVETERIDPYTSEISVWRDTGNLIRLHGPRCNACGAIQFPPQRICRICQAKDDFTDVPLSKEGALFTYTVEHLFPIPDKHLVTGVVDLAEGARLFTQVTDCMPDEVRIGMKVRLAFRSLHRGGGFYHYFWKAAPERD